MEENVARILQMLQEGKITVQEATTLIASVRGEQAAPAEEQTAKRKCKQHGRNGCPPAWLWLCLLCCRSPWAWLWLWLIYCAEAKAKKENGSSSAAV